MPFYKDPPLFVNCGDEEKRRDFEPRAPEGGRLS
jgi:hypothetical protein